MNELRKVFLAIAMVLGIIAMVSTATAVDDYFVYGVEDTGFITVAMDGYVIDDESGLLYVADWNGVCHIYEVSIPAGLDPDVHPDNTLNPGAMAPRTFVEIGTYDFKADCGWNGYDHAEFYISDNHIYYGVYNGGIEKWDKNADGTFGAYLGKVTDKNGDAIPGNRYETFGYDANNNIWYTGDRSRNIYSFDADVDTAWKLEFTYPNYGGSHHDGLEFVNGYLWVSDMTSDYLGQWEYNGTGWSEVDRFSYTYGKVVEGMGFGPLGHFWVSSYTGRDIYEIGGGKLGVALTDIPDQTIPDGSSFATFDLDDYAGGATGLNWTSSGSSDLTVSIDPGTHDCNVTYPSNWTGSETITFTATCPVGNINSDDATFTVNTTGPQVNLLNLVKTDNPDPVSPSGTLTYTLDYDNNNNNFTVNNVELTDTLPAGVTFVSASDNVSPDAAGIITWDIGTLGIGDSGSKQVVVTVDSTTSGTIVNNAEINSDETPSTTLTEPTTIVDPTPTTNASVVSSDSTGTEMNKFDLTDDVYCYAENLPVSDPAVDIYLVADKVWVVGDTITTDVSGSVETVSTDASGNIGVTQIWTAPLVAGKYDIVVDVNQNGVLDADEPVDGITLEGLESIPEFPTIVIPIAAILGLMFLFQRRKD